MATAAQLKALRKKHKLGEYRPKRKRTAKRKQKRKSTPPAPTKIKQKRRGPRSAVVKGRLFEFPRPEAQSPPLTTLTANPAISTPSIAKKSDVPSMAAVNQETGGLIGGPDPEIKGVTHMTDIGPITIQSVPGKGRQIFFDGRWQAIS